MCIDVISKDMSALELMKLPNKIVVYLGRSQILYSKHVILEHNKAGEPECLICGQWDALSRDINKCRPYCMHSHVG